MLYAAVYGLVLSKLDGFVRCRMFHLRTMKMMRSNDSIFIKMHIFTEVPIWAKESALPGSGKRQAECRKNRPESLLSTMTSANQRNAGKSARKAVQLSEWVRQHITLPC